MFHRTPKLDTGTICERVLLSVKLDIHLWNYFSELSKLDVEMWKNVPPNVNTGCPSLRNFHRSSKRPAEKMFWCVECHYSIKHVTLFHWTFDRFDIIFKKLISCERFSKKRKKEEKKKKKTCWPQDVTWWPLKNTSRLSVWLTTVMTVAKCIPFLCRTSHVYDEDTNLNVVSLSVRFDIDLSSFILKH